MNYLIITGCSLIVPCSYLIVTGLTSNYLLMFNYSRPSKSASCSINSVTRPNISNYVTLLLMQVYKITSYTVLFVKEQSMCVFLRKITYQLILQLIVKNFAQLH